MELKDSKMAVVDLDEDEGFMAAVRSEIRDPKVDKLYLDPWGRPYMYRENRSKREKRDWMILQHKYDFWSVGPDGVNQAWEGFMDDEEADVDDIGNW